MPGRTYQPDCHIMPAAPSRLLLVAAFGALYFIWGSTYLAIRFGVESWPPLLMAGIRFVIAGGLMFGWLRWRGTPLPSRSEWAGAARIGFLLLVSLVLYLFLSNLRASLAVVVVIPLSLLATFMGLKVLGVPANLLSLGAMDFGFDV